MRTHTGARIALINGGSLRASIAPGPVTLEDVFKSLPYANEIVRVQLTGAELLQVLTRSVAGKPEDEDGGIHRPAPARIDGGNLPLGRNVFSRD